MYSNEPSKEIAPPVSKLKEAVPSTTDTPVEPTMTKTDTELMIPQKSDVTHDHTTHQTIDQMLGVAISDPLRTVSNTFDTVANGNNDNENNINNEDSKTMAHISEEININEIENNISTDIPPSKVATDNHDENNKNSKNSKNSDRKDNDDDNDNDNDNKVIGKTTSLMPRPISMEKSRTVEVGRSADAEYGHLSRMGRLASQSSADTLKSPNTTTDERFLEFAEMHLAQALNEIHCPCFGKLIPCTLCCNEYSFWCCSLCLRANYNEWILIFLLFCAKILLWSVFAGEIHSACIPDGDESGNDNYCNNMWDVRLNYLYKEEVISNSTNYFVIGLWYIVIMFGSIGVTLLVDKNWRNKIVSSRDKRVIKCCNTCLCGREYARVALVLEVMFREILIVGFFNDVSTNMIKLFVGRPRPYYYDFFASDIDDDDDDVLKSFPSGHTSMAFAMYTLLTLHIAEAMTIARRRKYEIACMWELEHDKPYFLFCISIWRYFASPGVLILIAMTPIFMATWVGLSRINDNHHHYEDVIAGAFIGIIWAIIGFFIYKDEFRESSAKHDMLFEHFTSEIKLAFRRYIKKRRPIPYAPPTTSLKTNSSRESNKTATTTTNGTNGTNGTNANTNTAATTTEGATADIVINDNENNNNNKNMNNNSNNNNNNNNNNNSSNNNSGNSGSSERSGFDWNNFSISGFFQYGEFRKRQRSSRSCWFWCKIVCCSCDHDCSHIWQIFCCRHSPTDDANRRRVNREASLISPNISGMHHAHHQYHTSYDLYNGDNNNLPSMNEQMLYYSENTQFNFNNNIASCPQCSHQFAFNGMNNISKKKYGLNNNNNNNNNNNLMNNDSEIDNDCRQTTLKSMAVSVPHNSNKNNKNNKSKNKSMNNNNNNKNIMNNNNNNNNNNIAFRYNTPITATTGLISNTNDENSKNKTNKKNKNNKTEEKKMKKSSFAELQKKSFKKAHTEHTIELNKGKIQHANSQSPSPRGKYGSAGLSQAPLTQTRAVSDQHYMHS